MAGRGMRGQSWRRAPAFSRRVGGRVQRRRARGRTASSASAAESRDQVLPTAAIALSVRLEVGATRRQSVGLLRRRSQESGNIATSAVHEVLVGQQPCHVAAGRIAPCALLLPALSQTIRPRTPAASSRRASRPAASSPAPSRASAHRRADSVAARRCSAGSRARSSVAASAAASNRAVRLHRPGQCRASPRRVTVGSKYGCIRCVERVSVDVDDDVVAAGLDARERHREQLGQRRPGEVVAVDSSRA